MTIKYAGAILAGLLLSSPSWAQAPSVADADFVKKAAAGNTFEIEEAKLALQRATDSRLKAFAQKMIDDHGGAMQKLRAASGTSEAKPEMTLDPPHQAMLDNLQRFKGTDFDKIYIADQIFAHAETVALLSDYKQNGQDPDLKSWARDALPVVVGHQATINAM